MAGIAHLHRSNCPWQSEGSLRPPTSNFLRCRHQFRSLPLHLCRLPVIQCLRGHRQLLVPILPHAQVPFHGRLQHLSFFRMASRLNLLSSRLYRVRTFLISNVRNTFGLKARLRPLIFTRMCILQRKTVDWKRSRSSTELENLPT